MSTATSDVDFAASPLATLREGRLVRRLTQLFVGLGVYGVSLALLVRADLGLFPWDVLHQGLMHHVPLSFGTIVILTSVVVLLAWIPLRQWPGVGTICNAVVIGLVADVVLAVLHTPTSLLARGVLVVSGVVLNAVATAAYIGARLGPGPRDGLMTGLVRRTGKSVRLVRTTIELSVVVVGVLLGGTIGIGTLLYAFTIGPLVHVLLPLCTVAPRPPARPTTPVTSGDSLSA
ncbi:YczE/YyaS/YitT family protein [Thermasporomyces composti]|jgi:uncharacterized membrane protein YczE|uniref:Putative membrane protein YczE n=1 Tax=Thermasporomyces composti TaxID=696763 RepID=A0A3D9V1I2_THECX|nr:hypothetical protein [Thermasporomyces composti]REF35652.1 putative membrane protein YczE [Thermasporomyces composti]